MAARQGLVQAHRGEARRNWARQGWLLPTTAWRARAASRRHVVARAAATRRRPCFRRLGQDRSRARGGWCVHVAGATARFGFVQGGRAHRGVATARRNGASGRRRGRARMVQRVRAATCMTRPWRGSVSMGGGPRRGLMASGARVRARRREKGGDTAAKRGNRGASDGGGLTGRLVEVRRDAVASRGRWLVAG